MAQVKVDSRPVVLILGPSGTGKTRFTNLAAGRDVSREEDSLQSTEAQVQRVEIVLQQGYAIEVFDTPGLDSGENGDVKQYLLKLFHRLRREQRSIAGIVYMHDISQRRINKSVLDSFEWLLAVCGLRAMQNVVIVTTMWDSANTHSASRYSEFERREGELQKSDCCYQEAFRSGASLRRHNNTSESALAILQLAAHEQPVTLQCQSSHTKDAACGNSRASILGKIWKPKQSGGVSGAGRHK